MGRSLKKGPYIDEKLFERVEELNRTRQKKVLKTWSRRYNRGEQVADVLITSTGGDRHRIHPPAYCLTGDGWIVVGEEPGEAKLGRGRVVPVTRLKLTKAGKEMTFFYWFTDGTETRRGFAEMMQEDTVRRIGGRRTNWFLFRAMTDQGAPVLEDFLSTFEYTLKAEKP